MTSPAVSAELQTALDELDMARVTLTLALNNAVHSAVHSTYTAAIKRILFFNARTIKSTHNLLASLKAHAATNKH